MWLIAPDMPTYNSQTLIVENYRDTESMYYDDGDF